MELQLTFVRGGGLLRLIPLLDPDRQCILAVLAPPFSVGNPQCNSWGCQGQAFPVEMSLLPSNSWVDHQGIHNVGIFPWKSKKVHVELFYPSQT